MTAEDLRAAAERSDDLRMEPVDVPWDTDGEKVFVQGMSGTTYTQLIGSAPDVSPVVMAKVLARCLVTEDGERIFKDSDYGILASKSVGFISELFNHVSAISGADDPQAVAEDFERAQPGEASTG